MARRKIRAIEPGDKVIVVSPMRPADSLRGRVLAFRNGGRTAMVQDRYEWRIRRVPAEYVIPDS